MVLNTPELAVQAKHNQKILGTSMSVHVSPDRPSVYGSSEHSAFHASPTEGMGGVLVEADSDEHAEVLLVVRTKTTSNMVIPLSIEIRSCLFTSVLVASRSDRCAHLSCSMMGKILQSVSFVFPCLDFR